MRILLIVLISGFCVSSLKAQISNTYEENKDNWPEQVYNLTIDYETVNFTGKDVKAMTINGGLKRGNEWYLIKKRQVQSLDKLIKKNAVGAKP